MLWCVCSVKNPLLELVGATWRKSAHCFWCTREKVWFCRKEESVVGGGLGNRQGTSGLGTRGLGNKRAQVDFEWAQPQWAHWLVLGESSPTFPFAFVLSPAPSPPSTFFAPLIATRIATHACTGQFETGASWGLFVSTRSTPCHRDLIHQQSCPCLLLTLTISHGSLRRIKTDATASGS